VAPDAPSVTDDISSEIAFAETIQEIHYAASMPTGGSRESTGHGYSGVTSTGRTKMFNGDAQTGANKSHEYENGTSKDQSTMFNGNYGESGCHRYKNMKTEGESMMCCGNSNISAKDIGRGVFGEK